MMNMNTPISLKCLSTATALTIVLLGLHLHARTSTKNTPRRVNKKLAFWRDCRALRKTQRRRAARREDLAAAVAAATVSGVAVGLQSCSSPPLEGRGLPRAIPGRGGRTGCVFMFCVPCAQHYFVLVYNSDLAACLSILVFSRV